MPPAAQETRTVTVRVPASVATGTYYIGAIADYQNAVAEGNENNNALAGNQIAITKLYPDLVMTSVAGPSSASTKQQITVSGVVLNQGRVWSGAFYVGIYLSKDETITASDLYLGEAFIGSLGPGYEQVVSATVTIPASTARGTYYIGAIADRGSTVAESVETNNALKGNQIQISK